MVAEEGKTQARHRLVIRETELETGGSQRHWGSPKERATRQENPSNAQLLCTASPQVFRILETHEHV